MLNTVLDKQCTNPRLMYSKCKRNVLLKKSYRIKKTKNSHSKHPTNAGRVEINAGSDQIHKINHLSVCKAFQMYSYTLNIPVIFHTLPRIFRTLSVQRHKSTVIFLDPVLISCSAVSEVWKQLGKRL